MKDLNPIAIICKEGDGYAIPTSDGINREGWDGITNEGWDD